MNVEIVKNKQQLEEAFSIRTKVFIEEQKVDVEEEIDQFEESSTHFLLYNEHQLAIGTGRFRVVDGVGKVERICVLPDVRKSGAGKIIMQAIEDYAMKQELPKLKLNAQIHAIGFYEKLGYNVVSDEFLDAGIPHKTMTKTL
ncbi:MULTISPECIES: GNAT family N-acetyltransferase [Bacillus]|uniref:GNAT family N-acetyltransferase n=1 Tax=Bacillus TaxID=1386 RepID=UPI00031784D8|nr:MULTISPECIES: GNAT family N-acetyltransferase [Bacillus]